MSIGEHLSRVPEEIKLQDLILEKESKEELKFDPEREISEEDWEGMKNMLNDYRQGNDWESFASQAMKMKILFPERAEELNLDEGVWQGVKEKFEEIYNKEKWATLAGQAINAKILFPDKAKELNLNKEAWREVKDVMELWRNREWDIFTNMAVDIRLFLEKSEEINIDNETLQAVKKELEEKRQGNEWYNFAESAKFIKIFFPKKVKELNLNDEAWKGMKEGLEERRQGEKKWGRHDWDKFANLAMNMKILAAEEVKITDKGLEITMPGEKEDFKEETQSRPERREF